MSIGTEPGQYILQTQFKKNLKVQWGGEFERPLWVRRWAYLKLRQETKSGQPAEVNVW